MVVDDDEYDDFHAPNGVEPETRVLLFFFPLFTSCPTFNPFPGSVNPASKINQEAKPSPPTTFIIPSPASIRFLLNKLNSLLNKQTISILALAQLPYFPAYKRTF